MAKLLVSRMVIGSAMICVVGCGQVPGDDETVSSALTTATSAARGYTRPNGQHAIIYRDPIAQIRRHSGTPPGSPVSLGGNLCGGCSPWGYKRFDNVEAVLYLDVNRNVHEITVSSGGAVSDANFATLFGAPIADAESPRVPDIIGYVRSDGRNAMIYRSSGHIIEFASNFGHQPAWVMSDLTNVSGTTALVGMGTPFPYVRTDTLNTIVYVGNDNHIREMSSNFGGSPPWRDGDLSGGAQDPATPASSPWGYRRSDGVNAVLFISTIGGVHELRLKPGAPCGPGGFGWCATVLPSVTANGSFRPSGYVRGDSLNTVVYVTSTNGVHEISLQSGNWFDNPLPLPTNYIPVSELFGHLPPVDRASIVFEGRNVVTGDVNGVELRLPTTTSWVASAL